MTRVDALDSRVSGLEGEMKEMRSELRSEILKSKEEGQAARKRLEMMISQMTEQLRAIVRRLDTNASGETPSSMVSSGSKSKGPMREASVDEGKGVVISDLESSTKGDELVADESEADIDMGEALEIDGRFNGETNRVCPRAVVVGDISEKRFAVDDRKPQEEKEEVKLELEANLVEKQKRTESTGEGVELDLNTHLPIVVSHAVTGQDLHGEELARAFQKLVSKMARDVQSAVWVLGLKGQLEPEFLLVTGGEEFGSEVGPDLDLLGPPPWYDSALKEFGLTSYQILGADSTKGGFGSFLNLMGPFSWPNSVYKTTYSEQKLSGLVLMGPPPCEIREATLLKWILLLQPTELRNIIGDMEHNYERRSSVPPPPDKPPPQPPDFPPKWLRLEFGSAVPVVLVSSCPTSLRVSDKADAASADLSDIRFLHYFAFVLNFKYRLEGKAVFKGLARAMILTREEKYVEEWSYVLQPPPEPPPCVHGFISTPLNTNERDRNLGTAVIHLIQLRKKVSIGPSV